MGTLIELVEVLAVALDRVAGWRNAIVDAGSAVGLVGETEAKPRSPDPEG